jgi:spore coat protein CotH
MPLPTLFATVFCLGAMALGTASANAADEAAWLYDPDQVVEIDLGLSQAEIQALEDVPDEYQPGTFELRVGGEVKGPPLGDVGIRLKGETSFRPLTGKAAFKLKFNEFVSGQTFFGLKKMTLNNMVQDPSMIHETLTYQLFRELGVPASRTGFAFVRLNGLDYGVYLDIETLDKVSLPQWFDSTGHLYEGSSGTDVEPGEAASFEVDEGDEEDLSDLEALIAAANDTEGDWSEGMAGVADLREMTRMWAVERYVGHWDGYTGPATFSGPSNYYLHSDGAGAFSMLPWGTDQTWHSTPDDKRVEFGEPATGVLFNRCLADVSCRTMYVEALEEILVSDPAAFDSHAASLAAQLAPYQELEDEPRREFSQAEIESGVLRTREYITERPEELFDWLWPGVPLPALSLKRTPETEGGGDVGSPDTSITGAVIGRNRRRARFSFRGSGGTGPLGFLCKLDHRAFASCASPKTYGRLRPGAHTFRVKAQDQRAQTDPTPAVRHFRIPRLGSIHTNDQGPSRRSISRLH